MEIKHIEENIIYTFTSDVRSEPLCGIIVEKTFRMGEANSKIAWIACIF